MNKIIKFALVLLSTLGLILGTTTTSFSKVEGDTIILGAAVSLTGKYSTNGKHTQNGYNLAVKRINEMGGVKVGGKTYKFDIIYYDDESNSGRAAQLAERLIKQDGVKYMLGPYSSGLTKAIAPITEENKIPMVEANGASRSLFTKGYKYLFAVLSPANQYLEVAIDLAVEKNGGKGVKIAMAFEQDAFSQDVRLGIVDAAKRTGSKIINDTNSKDDIPGRFLYDQEDVTDDYQGHCHSLHGSSPASPAPLDGRCLSWSVRRCSFAWPA